MKNVVVYLLIITLSTQSFAGTGFSFSSLFGKMETAEELHLRTNCEAIGKIGSLQRDLEKKIQADPSLDLSHSQELLALRDSYYQFSYALLFAKQRGKELGFAEYAYECMKGHKATDAELKDDARRVATIVLSNPAIYNELAKLMPKKNLDDMIQSMLNGKFKVAGGMSKFTGGTILLVTSVVLGLGAAFMVAGAYALIVGLPFIMVAELVVAVPWAIFNEKSGYNFTDGPVDGDLPQATRDQIARDAVKMADQMALQYARLLLAVPNQRLK